jgi:hypothetical protein
MCCDLDTKLVKSLFEQKEGVRIAWRRLIFREKQLESGKHWLVAAFVQRATRLRHSEGEHDASGLVYTWRLRLCGRSCASRMGVSKVS